MTDLHILFWLEEESISPKIKKVLWLCWNILDVIPNPRLRLESKRRLIENLWRLNDDQLDYLLWLWRTLSIVDISRMFRDELIIALEG